MQRRILTMFFTATALLIFTPFARAQNNVQGNLTAQGTAAANCGTGQVATTSCLALNTVGFASATITIGSATFSGTVTFYVSGDGGKTWQTRNATPSNSTTAVTTATGSGTWQTSVSGWTNVAMVATGYSSGTINGSIFLSPLSTGSSGGGGGGGSGCVPGGSAGEVLTDTGSGTCADNTTATGFLSFMGTPSSANFFSLLTNPTGSGGSVVFATSPTLTTPNLGTPSAVNLSNATSLPCSATPALTGDTTTTSGSCATTTGKINGGSFPASAKIVGSNSSSQPILQSFNVLASVFVCTDTSSSATTYTCAPSPAPGTYAVGDFFELTDINQNNSGSATLNVNGLGAITIKKWGGTANLAAGDLPSGGSAWLLYDNAGNFEIQTIGNAPSGSGLPSGGVLNQQVTNSGASGSGQWTSPTVSVGNGGSTISLASASYTAKCDSSTAATGIQDRGAILIVSTGGSNDLIIPDLAGTGCSGMYGQVWNTSSSTITVSRQTSDTFTVNLPVGGSQPSTAQTTFTLAPGQKAFYSPDATSDYGIQPSNPTAAQVATLVQSLSGCNTATYVFTPQGSDCVQIIGSMMANNTVTATQLAAQYSKGSCTEAWSGSGASSALQSGDDAISNNTCYNDSGVTRTITAVKCRSDNASNTTTANPTFGSAGTGTTILSAAVTCGSSYAYSSSGTVTNASWTTGTGIDPGMGGTLTGTSIAVIVEYTF